MRIGRYEVSGVVARGGGGVVYRARSPEGAEVAVKVLLHQTGAAIARFERERRLQESLDERAGFVPLLDAGTADEGPFLVLPFLEGGTLRDRLGRGPLPIEEALALALALAEAMARAHALGLIHRDLKPENVLFTREGAPLISDLGTAKHFALDSPGASQSVLLSGAGELRGTAGYMAPEQARDARSATPAADVFSLGAILYELLAGRPPFVAENLLLLLAEVEAGKIIPLATLRPDVPAPLARVVERALAPVPEERFPDARALVRALEAAREGKAPREPVPVTALLAGLAAVVLVLASAVVIAWARRPAPATAPTPTPSQEPTPASLPSVAPRARPAFDAPLLARGFVDGPKTRLVSVLGRYDGTHAARVWCVAVSPDGKHALTGGDDGTVVLSDAQTLREISSATSSHGHIRAVAFTPDGSSAIVGTSSGSVELLDLGSGQFVREIGRHKGPVTSLAVPYTGEFVISSSEDKSIVRWSVATDAPPLTLTVRQKGDEFSTPVSSVAFVSDLGGGGRILAGHGDGYARLWDYYQGTLTQMFVGHGRPVTAVAFSPDGLYALTGTDDGKVRLFEVAKAGRTSARFVLSGQEGAVRALAFAGPERFLAAGDDGTVRVFHVSLRGGTGELVRTLTGHTDRVTGLATLPDGLFALSSSYDRTVGLWDLVAGKEARPPTGHRGFVAALAALPDGRQLATAGHDGVVQLWDLARGELRLAVTRKRVVVGLATDPRGRFLVASEHGGALALLDVESGAEVLSLPRGASAPTVLAATFVGDGKKLLTADEGGAVELWDLARSLEAIEHGLRPLPPLPPRRLGKHASHARRVAVSASGRFAASVSDEGAIVWDLVKGVERARFAPGKGVAPEHRIDPRTAVAFSPDETRLLVGDAAALALFELETGARVTSFEGAASVRDARFSPSGAYVAAAMISAPNVRLYKATGELVAAIDLTSSNDRATSVEWARDGKSFFVGTGRGLVLEFEVK